jgi:predicted transcriptional regulator
MQETAPKVRTGAESTIALRPARWQVYSKYTMPTSVHIPKPLLLEVDRRARALKISRNRFIVQALEREVKQGSAWSPAFFERLAAPEPGVEVAADELRSIIQKHRRSKKPVRL